MNSHTKQIRVIARQWRRESLGLAENTLVPTDQLLALADSHTGYARLVLPGDDPLLSGAQAVLDREAQLIWQSADQHAHTRAVDAAHEYGHLVLHKGTCQCSAPADLGDTIDADGAPLTVRTRVDGYSARQRREYEANIFAAELLLPSDAIRQSFFAQGWNAASIARELGLSPAFVRTQLAQNLLTPAVPAPLAPVEPVKPVESPSAEAPGLDESQQKAAEWEGAPYLLGAGPGTGKTRTLVARCVHLVHDRGVAPESILALTFSRKAADEMRERLLAAGIGSRDAGPWVGTFHSFGLDILRRYGYRLGITRGWQLLDSNEAFRLLEENLERLELDELANVNNPTLYLRDILGAISRAKDELCTPSRYLKLATRMKDNAGDELKAFREASRCVETAHAYAVYQQILAENNAVGFGDLIYRAVELLWKHRDVAADMHAEYPHVLADEYQDVNRGCARLLQLAAGSGGANLWVVGDHRQSIYRFRGASPANIAAFQHDYHGGVRDELAVNYRSRAQVVDLFSGAASKMAAEDRETGAFAGWRSNRGVDATTDVPAVVMAVADDEDAQAEGISRAIGEHKNKGGYKFADMAILCRTHFQAAALAQRLASRDVPVHYGENLLDRPEVKDLLSLLQATTSDRSSAIGLLRFASRSEFRLSADDAAALARRVAESELPAVDALERPEVIAGFEDHSGVKVIRRILAALRDIIDPADCLERYLFQESDYLRDELGSEAASPPADLPALSRITAIRQLVEMATAFRVRTGGPADHGDDIADIPEADPTTDAIATTAPSADPRLTFLHTIRRMLASGERPTLDLGDSLAGFDAVRMITAHAAKGLEFPVVFVPNLSDGRFPPYPRDAVIPEPPGMVQTFTPTAPQPARGQRPQAADPNRQEEECLFFVAISRAREHLILSRAERYASSDIESAPSPLLGLIDDGLRDSAQEVRWTGGTSVVVTAPGDESAAIPASRAVTSTELDHYLRCPRQYYYARRVKLTISKFITAGELFHRAMNETLRWLNAEWAAGNKPEEADTTAEFDRLFQHGDHIQHDTLYREKAAQILTQVRETWQDEGLKPVDRADKLVARLDTGNVRAVADLVAYDRTGTLVIARNLLGKPQDRDHTDPRLSLFRRAADDTAPGMATRIEVRYLAEGHKRTVGRSDKWDPQRVKRYENAMTRIAKNDFRPAPREPGMCAACPYYFICPA
ncbi:MAG TPA: UvrD-helicase domain-containing protein [Capsulimonadaceae bacterium]|jgi:superfamily I DNA/RNA helicase